MQHGISYCSCSRTSYFMGKMVHKTEERLPQSVKIANIYACTTMLPEWVQLTAESPDIITTSFSNDVNVQRNNASSFTG